MHLILLIDDKIDVMTARTISKNGVASYDYIRKTPGSERVGGVTLGLERLEYPRIEFVEDIQSIRGTDDVSYWYVRGVMRAIEDICNDGPDDAGPITGIRFTLRELMIDPIDSKEIAFNFATRHALREFFKGERLVAFKLS